MGSTANQRLKNQRQARIQAGWQEIRVWVPTKDDAKLVQELAAKLRAKALDVQVIEKLTGVKTMNDAIRKRVLAAIENQGSGEYTTPSGAFLELLSELAKTGYLSDMSTAFDVFVAAHPSNANFVASSVGSKILNHYLIPSLGLNGANKFLQWQENHLNWATTLADSLQYGNFQQVVERMLAEINQKTAEFR